MIMMIAYLVVLLALGSWCLFSAKNVQAYASRFVSPALKAYIESNTYLVGVRIGGLVAYAMAVLLAVALYRGGAQ
jgi:hypothetical protein